MANLYLLSRKAFVMCYCFRAPIKTFFFDACQMTVFCQIVCPALVSGPPNRKKPFNKHLISLVFSVRTVNYGSSFSRLGHKSMEKSSVRNLQYGPKTRLIRGTYTSQSSIKLNIVYFWLRSKSNSETENSLNKCVNV